MTQEQQLMQSKIDKLRQEWRDHPERRENIELQVRVLKTGMSAKPVIPHMKEFKKPTADDLFTESVKESLT